MIHITRADAVARMEQAITIASAEGFSVALEERQDSRGAWYAWLVGECLSGHCFAITVARFLRGQRCLPCRMEARAETWVAVAESLGYEVQPVMFPFSNGRSERVLVGACGEGHPLRMRPSRLLAGERCAQCFAENAKTRWLQAAREAGYIANVERRLERGALEPYLVGVCPGGHAIAIRTHHFMSGQRCTTCSSNAHKSKTAEKYLAVAREEGFVVNAEVVGPDILLVGRCPNGHDYRAQSYVFGAGSRCRECRLDVARSRHLVQARAEGFTVTIEIREGPTQNYSWLVGTCPSNHRVEVHLSAFNRGTRCAVCARSGFATSLPAHLYVLRGAAVHGQSVIQFGISNRAWDRLAVHRRNGFTEVIGLLHSVSGRTVLDIETAIKRSLRAMCISTCAAAGIRFDGASESFLEADLSLSDFSGVVSNAITRSAPDLLHLAVTQPMADLLGPPSEGLPRFEFRAESRRPRRSAALV